MARGTKKRYFKKNKTRNNKKIRKQRRMKKSNKSRKRKQIKKSRKRKAGLKYYQLTKEQRNWLKSKHLFNPLDMYKDVDEVIKHALDDPTLPPRVRRRRGFYTTYIKKPKTNKKKLKDEFDLRTDVATEVYNEAETARKESVKTAAIEDLYMTIQNAMNKLNNNKSDELKTINAIQNAIKIAEDKGVDDDDVAMEEAKEHLEYVYQKLEDWEKKHKLKVRKALVRENEWRRANATVNTNRPQGKKTEDDSDSESDSDSDSDSDPDGGGDDNTPWYQGPAY
jgi:hypothetical protein